jgi:fumarate reductase subunit D
VVAHASGTHRVAILSLPALGALNVRRRARESIVRLVDGLLGESLELRAAEESQRRLRVGRRLRELAAPVRRELPDDEDVDLRFVAAVVRGNLRLLTGMVRANRPWRLIVHLSRALAAALAAVAFALVTSDVWRISDRAGWPSLLVFALASLVGTILWLIVAHGLWERASHDDREQVVLFNTATTLTVALGVATLYAAVFVLALMGALILIDHGLLAQSLSHPVGFWDYAGLAWLISSLATVGGALGSALESDVAVREAAYGYRPDRATEREAARADIVARA